MKAHLNPSPRKTIKGRPDYYITPTRDFTQYTKDSEEKYWNKETKFDWQQSVTDNLKEHLDNLGTADLAKITFMVLPMVKEAIERKIIQIKQSQLPIEKDALKDITEYVPFDKSAIHQAILILAPLKDLQVSVSKLKDQLEILNSELLDLREQQRLGVFRKGTKVKQLETDEERQEQTFQISHLTNLTTKVQTEIKELKTQYRIESDPLIIKIKEELHAIEPEVLLDLEETQKFIEQTLQAKRLPEDDRNLSRLKDLILKRQLRGLKDIANHALVVEQSAIAPLTMGIIHYKRYREIQEAMTTFIHDEAKHSATFRRFLVEKLEAKEHISAILIKGANRYMWLARYMPATGMFLAVIVEAIGAAYLEFFANEKYMPDKLFCNICKTISTQDEKRHIELCVAMYNELFRKANRWERLRNQTALKMIMKSVYGDKNEDHHLIQAFRAFGVESDILYRHILCLLSDALARVGIYVAPDKLLQIILGKRMLQTQSAN